MGNVVKFKDKINLSCYNILDFRSCLPLKSDFDNSTVQDCAFIRYHFAYDGKVIFIANYNAHNVKQYAVYTSGWYPSDLPSLSYIDSQKYFHNIFVGDFCSCLDIFNRYSNFLLHYDIQLSLRF